MFFATSFRRADRARRSRNPEEREGGARRTGLKSPSLLSLDRSLRISSTSPTSAASCSGLRFGEGGRGRVSGARAGRSRMSFRGGRNPRDGGGKAATRGGSVRRGRIEMRAHSQSTDIIVVIAPEHLVETLEARRGSPRRECPEPSREVLFLTWEEQTMMVSKASMQWEGSLPRWTRSFADTVVYLVARRILARSETRANPHGTLSFETTRWPP